MTSDSPSRGAGAQLSHGGAVLLVDIGNTRIKWTIWRDGRLGRMRAAFHAGWSQRDYERELFGGPAPRGLTSRAFPQRERRLREARSKGRPAAISVASVAGAGANRLLARAAAHAWGVRPRFIVTSRRAAGVTTRYVDTWRLGVDRFAGVIGARSLLGAGGACVINVGTAVTIDLLDARGVHRGGVILPGPRMMVSSLVKGTAGIGKRARDHASSSATRGRGHAGLFARSTRDAIERGARYAVASAVDRAVLEAQRVLGEIPRVLLTGGGAEEIDPLIQAHYIRVPDLVLRGIAAHAGLALHA
jgi:type III pantothenate kinase